MSLSKSQHFWMLGTKNRLNLVLGLEDFRQKLRAERSERSEQTRAEAKRISRFFWCRWVGFNWPNTVKIMENT